MKQRERPQAATSTCSDLRLGIDLQSAWAAVFAHSTVMSEVVDRSTSDLVASKNELAPSKNSIVEDTANIFQEMLRRKIHQCQCESRKRKVKWIFAIVSEKLPQQFSSLSQMAREIACKDRQLERVGVNEPRSDRLAFQGTCSSAQRAREDGSKKKGKWK